MDDLDSQMDDLSSQLRETTRLHRAERQAARLQRAERQAEAMRRGGWHAVRRKWSEWRAVRMTRAERTKAIAAFLAFLILGLLPITAGIGGLLQEQAFAERGVTVTGTVADLRTSGIGEDFSYWVDYEFVVPETGVRLRDTDSLKGSDWHALRRGGPIAVMFLPADPATNRVGGGDVATMLLMVGIGAVLVAGGIVGLLAFLPRRAGDDHG